MAVDLASILTSLQNVVNAGTALVRATANQSPTDTSGQLAADTLIQTGFVRVLGVSVVAGGAAGGLYDAATITGATTGRQLYVVGTVAGFFPVNMVFPTGLVYKPGAGQKAAIFYTRI